MTCHDNILSHAIDDDQHLKNKLNMRKFPLSAEIMQYHSITTHFMTVKSAALCELVEQL
jgi:hypothetical protein